MTGTYRIRTTHHKVHWDDQPTLADHHDQQQPIDPETHPLLLAAPRQAHPSQLLAILLEVDVASATWTNTIGGPELITAWKDPDFDAKLRAFYNAPDRDPDAALDGL
jgi:Protein of unknown function (DUF3604)